MFSAMVPNDFVHDGPLLTFEYFVELDMLVIMLLCSVN